MWQGPDGKTIIAALNPGSYGSGVTDDLSKEPPPPPAPNPNAAPAGRGGRGVGRREEDWVKRIDLDGKVTGVYADYHYVGTGDIGGATTESSVKLLEAMSPGTDLEPDRRLMIPIHNLADAKRMKQFLTSLASALKAARTMHRATQVGQANDSKNGT